MRRKAKKFPRCRVHVGSAVVPFRPRVIHTLMIQFVLESSWSIPQLVFNYNVYFAEIHEKFCILCASCPITYFRARFVKQMICGYQAIVFHCKHYFGGLPFSLVKDKVYMGASKICKSEWIVHKCQTSHPHLHWDADKNLMYWHLRPFHDESF